MQIISEFNNLMLSFIACKFFLNSVITDNRGKKKEKEKRGLD